ncbi:MAG: 6-carboxytetrahydropterin synthase [Phycisphaerales bacterium]|nr:6-carboxytetrahydropterin synthase [Phycisphaerales bacterium]
MKYRVCKAFEIESGHMLLKHPGRCRYPHGHTRRVEVVVSREKLDANDMVCDFKAIKLALADFLDRFDHALVVNAADPLLECLQAELKERVVVFEGEDPTTEVLARRIYTHLEGEIREGREYVERDGERYSLPRDLVLECVRVGETSTSWAEYGL